MPEKSYWLPWKLCARAGALSVLDWQVTFAPNLATVKSANLPFDETSASLPKETA
jgi:hypothetical protein